MIEFQDIGDVITFTVGRIRIDLQWVREDAYSVTAYQGGTYRIEEYENSWEKEEDARGWARMVAADAYRAQGMPAPCGCWGLGWIDLGQSWHPCWSCNREGRVARPPVMR